MENKKEEKKIIEVDIDDILPNRFQPRIKFNEKALLELAESIKEHGVLQPIILRPIGDKYEIIVGERRYKASVLAGKSTIPAIISNLDDKNSAEIALIENVQRENLTPIEEAISYKKILEMSYLTQNELAEKLDKNQSTIANKLRLLNLEIEVQEALLDEKISERHARSLLKLENSEDQLNMLNKIIDERMTVRQTDKAISEILLNSGKKEEEIMDKENNFNIPTSPIIEEVVEEPIANIELDNNDNIYNTEIEEELIPTTESDVNMTSLNPGFMDINKIENEASDIYVEKPVADIDNLLKPEIKEEKPVIDENLDDGVFSTNSNRFFNFGNLETDEEEDNDDEVKEKEEIETQEITEEIPPINNFDFNTFFTPIEEESKEELESTNEEEIIDIVDFDDFNETDEKAPESIQEPINNVLSFEPVYEEPEEITNNIQEPTNDLRSAINIVRKCSKELENLGYVIDVEELDFENTYQVTFKISK